MGDTEEKVLDPNAKDPPTCMVLVIPRSMPTSSMPSRRIVSIGEWRTGKKALEIILAIYKSQKTGQPVLLSLGLLDARDERHLFDALHSQRGRSSPAVHQGRRGFTAYSQRLLPNRISEFLVHTGQHYDENMSAVFFREMEIPEPDINLEVGSGLHGAMTGAMLAKLEAIMMEQSPMQCLSTAIPIRRWRGRWPLRRCTFRRPCRGGPALVHDGDSGGAATDCG